MNSLLERESMGGEVQLVYMDPPFGIKYNSNFQPFTNRIDKTGKHLTAEPEMLTAFRDTWELGVHSYLSYLKDRLLLAKQLLKDSGSCIVQIGKENVHRLALLLDEVFGPQNRVTTITYSTATSGSGNLIPEVAHYLLWYAKDIKALKFRKIYEELSREEKVNSSGLTTVELEDGTSRNLKPEEKDDISRLPQKSRLFLPTRLLSEGHSTTGRSEPYSWNGKIFDCPNNQQWRVSHEGLDRLAELNRLFSPSPDSKRLYWKRYEDELQGLEISNHWKTALRAWGKRYVVETSPKVLERCITMATDPGDIVFDPTCGGGTTAYVAEQLGRRWITCDTSRVALNLARQRLMTASFTYYQLANPSEGVGSGFIYEPWNKVSAGSLAYDRPPGIAQMLDRPLEDKTKCRVAGPFTVEAVPAPTVMSIDDGLPDEAVPQVEIEDEELPDDGLDFGIAGLGNDDSAAREGETLRQYNWREHLRVAGIKNHRGDDLKFTRLEPLIGVWRHLHAIGELDDELSSQAVVNFGPAHAPLEQRKVELALSEAKKMDPVPDLVVFAAFQFDPEAAKDIAEASSEELVVLKVQMNPDLYTADLKTKKTGESFLLVGQPDVEVMPRSDSKFTVEVRGFDYFDAETGKLVAGEADEIALWLLDTDYDGRSMLPTQVFFPLEADTGGWSKLAKSLKCVIDEDRIEDYHGTVSLPFKAGEHECIAVKIVDIRGVESLRVINLP